MKKRIEGELISIAHRILKLKGKAEIDQLYSETQKLYEILSVLKFVEDNINVVQPKMNIADIEQKLEHSLEHKVDKKPIPIIEKEVFEAVNHETEPELTQGFEKRVNIETNQEASTEFVSVKNENQNLSKNDTQTIHLRVENNDVLQVSKDDMPKETVANPVGIHFEKTETPIAFEKLTQPKMQQISFEDLLGHQISEPIFDKKQDATTTLNDTLGKNASFSLNDKIGFVNNLFDGSDEDFNRVVSQIGTFSNFAEATSFVTKMIKPDYNNWENKEAYEVRFMEIIERKFL